ncbi:MAG: hypothetical protein D6720_10255 [Gammaproteobacteria bacterium]|nr:MAG: hypothetical protein D6720_10255 [Gammaproteobacteria bacterium]
MQIPFSEKPGRHERHYRRRLDNPLFESPAQLSDEALLEAQRLDHEELVAFVEELRQVVARAAALKPKEESEVVLTLKADLERLYETAAGLADEQGANQEAIEHLLGAILRTIRANAEGDALAAQELGMEAQARALHFRLLEQPLVADLLHPETLIGPEELVPTLLSESEAAVGAALQLFDPAQRAQLAADARTLLMVRDPEARLEQAWARLAQIEATLSAPD